MRSPVMGSMNYESNYPSLLKTEELAYSGYQHTVVLVVMKRLMNLLKEEQTSNKKSPYHNKAEEDNYQEYVSSQDDT